MGISAYHFYKLIEVAIKLERDFPRGIIKHLNRVSGRLAVGRLAWPAGVVLWAYSSGAEQSLLVLCENWVQLPDVGVVIAGGGDGAE